MNNNKWKLSPDKLRKIKSPESWKLKDTNDINDSENEGLIGQQRAIEAMDFGLEVSGRGYNIFVVGHPGNGRTSYS